MSARLKLPAPSTVPVALPVAQSTKIKHGSRMVSNLVSIYSPKSWVHRHRGANRIVLILVHESHFGPRIKALSFQRSRATCVKRHRSSIANTRRWFNCALDRSRSVRWLSGWTLGAGSHRIGASQKFPRWRLAGDWSCRFHSARRRQGTWRRAFDPDSRRFPRVPHTFSISRHFSRPSWPAARTFRFVSFVKRPGLGFLTLDDGIVVGRISRVPSTPSTIGSGASTLPGKTRDFVPLCGKLGSLSRGGSSGNICFDDCDRSFGAAFVIGCFMSYWLPIVVARKVVCLG